jgi:hypothetical protein
MHWAFFIYPSFHDEYGDNQILISIKFAVIYKYREEKISVFDDYLFQLELEKEKKMRKKERKR